MKKIFIACLMLSLFSCTRAEKESATSVTLNIPADFGQKNISPNDFSTQGLNSGIVPASLADMNCFVALVAGPEEKMRDNLCEYKITSEKFSVGMVMGGFPRSGATGSQISFEVPNGKDRSIYLVGFKIDSTTATAAGTSVERICTNLIKDEGMDIHISEPYMLATANGIAMSGEELSLNMTASLNLSSKIGDCRGPDFPNGGNGGSSGPPAQFGVAFQDGVGMTNSKPLSYDKCVGVRFQVQDTAGKRADISSNPSLIAKVKMVYAGQTIGTFYHTGGSHGCKAGTEISSGSADMTIAFSTGNTAFSDFVAYFAPNDPLSSTGTIVVENNGSTQTQSPTSTPINMQTSTTTFYYTGTSTPPVKYAIYDLFTNTSTASTTTVALPIVIKAGQCRQGALQFLDMNGVPSRMNLSGVFRSVDVTATDASLKFYASSSDCSASSGDHSTAVIPMPTSTNYGAYNFYYKVSVSPTFGFSAVNGAGTSTPAIASGDISGSSNFWKAE